MQKKYIKNTLYLILFSTLLILVRYWDHLEAQTILPNGKGKKEVISQCTRCHGIRKITEKKFSEEKWQNTIDWMIHFHKMDPISKSEKSVIVQYLNSNFGPDLSPTTSLK